MFLERNPIRPGSPILVVSHDERVREDLSWQLREAGYGVLSVTTAAEAAAWADAHHATGTIVYDCRERTDWAEFHQRCRGPVLDDLAVIRLMNNEDLLFSDGAFCICEPILPAELLELVGMLCGVPQAA